MRWIRVCGGVRGSHTAQQTHIQSGLATPPLRRTVRKYLSVVECSGGSTVRREYLGMQKRCRPETIVMPVPSTRVVAYGGLSETVRGADKEGKSHRVRVRPAVARARVNAGQAWNPYGTGAQRVGISSGAGRARFNAGKNEILISRSGADEVRCLGCSLWGYYQLDCGGEWTLRG